MNEIIATIPLIAEQLEVSKRQSEHSVDIRTVVETRDVTASANLLRGHVDIRRVPIDREVQDVPSVRTEGGVLIIPVFEERAIVEKRLFLVEELHVREVETSEDVEIPVTLRSTRAVVERGDPQQETE